MNNIFSLTRIKLPSLFSKASLPICMAMSFYALPGHAAEALSQNKKLTIIQAHGPAQNPGPSESKLLEECILSLPSASTVEAVLETRNLYLKGINGTETDNRWVKTYTATLEISYLVKQKELVIVPVSSIEGKEPKMETFVKKLPQKEVFVSDPENGDIFAGRSNRQSYFSDPEKARQDVLLRAKVWINQNSHLLCKE